jgi:phage-related protein
VRRKFVPFDEETIKEELRKLPSEDRAKLLRAMKRYQECAFDDPRPAVIDKYASKGSASIYRLKNADREGQGRLLFYPWPERAIDQNDHPVEILIDLVVYKKEGDDVPERYLETARRRMADHRKRGTL